MTQNYPRSKYIIFVCATNNKSGDVSGPQLAKYLGVNKSTVNKWTQGAEPKLEHLIGICDFFNLSHVYLITGVDDWKSTEALSSEALAIAEHWAQLDEEAQIIIEGKIFEFLREGRKANTENRADAYGKKAT